MSVGPLALVLSPALEREEQQCEQDKRAMGMGALLSACKTLVLGLSLGLIPVLTAQEHVFQQNLDPNLRKIYVLNIILL